MAITVFTGLPGHGKTSFLVEHLLAEAKEAKRPIYYAGIDGLKPGLATEVDPKRWHEPGVVEDGAIIYIDEAWKQFGHLHDASRSPTPAHVLALAEHRHRGIDFYWTTQSPIQIYPFARSMIEQHHHCVRQFGTPLIKVFSWGELNEDVKSATKRDNAISKLKPLPREAQESFVSATVHTVKARIPWRLALIPLGVIVAGLLLWFVVQRLRPSSVAAHAQGQEAPAPGTGAAQTDNKRETIRYATAAEYHAMLTPRVADAPWTAPAFDGRPVQADPKVFCMASSAGEGAEGEPLDDSCRCVTEQGTPFDAGPETCKRMAREGAPYNPFLAPKADGGMHQGEERTASRDPVASAEATPTASPRGTGQPFGTMAGYGAPGVP